jgi:hypothetical protein
MIPKTALATITILLASVMLFSQVNDPWIGTWSLNVQKSSIMSFSMASRMVEYQPIPDGVRAVSDSTPVDGAAVHLEYAAKYDGTDGPIIGPLGQPIAGQTMAVTRFNSSTFETLQKCKRNISYPVTEQRLAVFSRSRDRTVQNRSICWCLTERTRLDGRAIYCDE